MIPHKLQEVGCTNTNTHIMYRGELFILKMESIILPSAMVPRMRLAAIPVQKPNNG
jgi:hypothetical protein